LGQLFDLMRAGSIRATLWKSSTRLVYPISRTPSYPSKPPAWRTGGSPIVWGHRLAGGRHLGQLRLSGLRARISSARAQATSSARKKLAGQPCVFSRRPASRFQVSAHSIGTKQKGMQTADGADGVLPRRLQLKRVGRIAALAIEDGPEPGRTPSRASHGRQALSGFGYGVPGQCRAGTGGAENHHMEARLVQQPHLHPRCDTIAAAD